jgi:serine/threonine protein kinase
VVSEVVSEVLDVTKMAPGTVLMGKYRVKHTLGEGGMGIVIACDHLTLGNTVAIKFLLPTLVSNENIVKRFMLEAKAATRISSEHVARVLDVGTLSGEGLPPGGVPFMVMEYLEGKDLSDWVRMGKKFPIDETIDYAIQACEALAQAHKQGIIHRDIKPANLFLSTGDDRKVVKVLDFGISKIVEEEPQEMGLTKTTTVLGSGLYMSPEQMRSAKKVDFRTDIYSLGVCVFELLTGTQPHTAETFSELCVKVNIDPPAPLRDYRPDIAEDLAAVIARAYAKEVDHRYQTIQEFAMALAPYAGDALVPAINQIQGITRHRSMPPPAPVPVLTTGAASAVARTAAGVTASAGEPKRSGGIGMVLTAGFVTIVMVAGVGMFLMRTRTQNQTDQAATKLPAESTVPAADTPSEPATPEPSASSNAVPEYVDAGVAEDEDAGVDEGKPAGEPAPKNVQPKPGPKPKPDPKPVVKPKPPCKTKIVDGIMVPCL